MKSEKNIGLLVPFVLSFLIALAGAGCLISAFELSGPNPLAAAFPAILCCGAYLLLSRIKWGRLVFALAGLLLLGFLLLQPRFLTSLEALLYQITIYYHRGYGWGILSWSGQDLSQAAVAGGLSLVITLTALSVCHCIHQKTWAGFGLLAGLLPLFACCVVTDTIPASGWVWLLLTALVIFTLTHLSRRENTKNANRLLAWVLIPVLLASSLLFTVSSPETYQGQSQGLQDAMDDMLNAVLDFVPDLGLGIGNIVGLVNNPTDLDLTTVGPTKQRHDTVMWFDTALASGIFYLRGRSYNIYTGTNWESTLDTRGENGWPTGGLSPTSDITVKTYFSATLQYFPYYISEENWTTKLEQGALVNEDRSREYHFQVMRPESKPSAQYQPLNNWEYAAYTALPQSTKQAALDILQSLWAEVNPGGESLTDSQKANFIGRFVCFSADYSLDTEKMPADQKDFAIWFLEEGETGYCTHFATAAAVLLRAAGIPARYVTGYAVNLGTQNHNVTSSHAHAWVEYLHPDYGWTVLDPTPGMNRYSPFEPEPTEPPTTQPTESTEPTKPTDTTLPTESTQSTEPTGTTLPTEASSPTATLPTGQPNPTGETQTPGPDGQDSQWNLEWVKNILWALAAWATLAGQDKLRKDRRRKRMTQGDPNRQALARWRYCKLLAWLTGLSADSLLPLAEKATFSQHTLAEEELSEFDTWIKNAKGLLRQKPLPLRILIRLVYAIE